jgi:biofilm PGA synthesis N-glycosyltransferase PgaC
MRSAGSAERRDCDCSYVLVTPGRNEARFIEMTIKSVVAQTVRPVRWIIVSDGSTDGTDEIVDRYVAQHDWIELVRQPERTERHFAGKVDAFNAGYARVQDLKYDVIGNLDADISFDDPDYFQFLMSKFSENPRLGVGGTSYREGDQTYPSGFTSIDDVFGACQMFRRECFEAIGGYQPVRTGGIDLIALLSARAKGWQTRTFVEKTCLHHRKAGRGQHAGICEGLLHAGRKDYLHGSHPGFQVFRSVYRMIDRPYVVGGVLTLVGYFWAMFRRVDRTVPDELIALRRSDQMQRLKRLLRWH